MIIDDTDTNPTADTEPVTTSEEVTEPEPETEGESEEALEGQSEEELEEIEEDGKKAKVPAWLKPKLMMQADYTKKTQEVAEQRKAHEAAVQSFSQRQQAFHEDAQQYAGLMALDQAIRQYEQQIPQLRQQGHNEHANRLWMELQEMRNAAGQISVGLQQKQQQRSAEAEREYANRLKERDTALSRDISGFTPALMSKIQDYAISDGYTSQEAQSLVDPRYVKTLNKARMWDEYQAKAKAAAKQAKQQDESALAPTPTIQGRKPNPNRLSDQLSAAEWVKRRNAQLRASR
jgi:hypothetical protein